MEYATELPWFPRLPDFMAILKRIAQFLENFARNSPREEKRREVQGGAARLLSELSPLMDSLPKLAEILPHEGHSPASRQLELGIDFMLRDILSMLDIIYAKAHSRKNFNSAGYAKLKKYIRELGHFCQHLDGQLISRSNSPFIKPLPKTTIGGIQLLTPLRIFIEDDDSGKYVECLEIPQVYGFGETEEEALEMLDREILSLRRDVMDSDNVADEYKYACDLIDMALGHE